ncbi:protein FAM214A [Schistocerca serialis cubense]|uniref:protein FAM214A n=1 Tax=Schistocerca serialis cubense TaxID=2023355 RepID=UPI00214F2E9A|nr:protein FAM214A [Schistocerca serialis cubense]XP_049953797.1 protein FAM214A [Schistocerca serialis cubense]
MEAEAVKVLEELGMLVVEGRVQGECANQRGYGEGPHISAKHHVCSLTNALCVRAEKLRKQVQLLHRNGMSVCVEVLKCADCTCGNHRSLSTEMVNTPLDTEILLEQWTVNLTENRYGEAPMTVRGLFQAVRSQLHFSQLSAWWSNTKGCNPSHIMYRLTVPDQASVFPCKHEEHTFPLAALSRNVAVKVCLRSLPRTDSIPQSLCPLHNTIASKDTRTLTSTSVSGIHRHPCKYQSPPPTCRDVSEDVLIYGTTPSVCRENEDDNHGVRGSCGSRSSSSSSTSSSSTVSSSSSSSGGGGSSSRCDVSAPEPGRRRGRHATLRRRDIKDTAHGVVDDRMRNPCTRSGKHRCSCGDDDDLDLESDYTKNGQCTTKKLELSNKELGEVLAVLRDKNAPSRSFTQGANKGLKTTLDMREHILSKQASVGSSSRSYSDVYRTHVSTTSSDDQGFQRVCGKSKNQEEALTFEKPLVLSEKVLKNKHKLSTSKSAFNDCDNSKSHCDIITGMKSINLQDCDTSDISIIGRSELPSSVQTSVLVSEQKAINKGAENTCSKLSAQLSEGYSEVRTWETTLETDNHFKCVREIQTGSQEDGNLPDTSLQSDTECSTKFAVGNLTSVNYGSKCTNVTKNLNNEIKSLSEVNHNWQVPSARDKARFRRSLDSAASMVFHCRTGLPLTSSPAPVRRTTSTTRFDFDSTLNSVSAIRSALFESSDDSQSTSSDDAETPSPVDTVPPGNFLENAREDFQRLRYSGYPCSSLLGSFEESVLNGRLEPVSTVHGFTADLGASGSFCPRHLVLPVTVFFYTLGDNDKVSTPYLGHINLGKKGYNVPRSGTVQVTLFNPLGTVVKMFVVMYDLCDMPANSQTFLRQRTLYMPANLDGKQPYDAQKWLRYLIHLRFSSSKSGRIYLHTDIRMIIFRKADMDTATAHGLEMSYELRSFTHGPTNPKFSPRQ